MEDMSVNRYMTENLQKEHGLNSYQATVAWRTASRLAVARIRQRWGTERERESPEPTLTRNQRTNLISSGINPEFVEELAERAMDLVGRVTDSEGRLKTSIGKQKMSDMAEHAGRNRTYMETAQNILKFIGTEAKLTAEERRRMLRLAGTPRRTTA